ncbi:GAS domain-containing protein [Tenacibaculum agarivorans]|uniref:tail fiber protein n=1 Tax=Tenacibaculum agarivorans TaxID=1908389 RepID=UPI00094BB6B1|nr:tail fiber protein [Tenacibaculum agarivorans]
MKKTILSIFLLGASFISSAQWTNTGDNTTTGKVTAKEYTFPHLHFDFSKMPRTQISPMSIKLFDDYHTYRPGGSSPDNNAYGTLLAINGRTSHWENNIYFGAVTNKMYFRISKYRLHTAENGVQGDYNNWRTLLDNMSDVKSSKLLKIEGDGNHYISKGKLGLGTNSPSQNLEIESGSNDGSNPPVIRLTSKDVNAVNNQLLGEIQFYNKDADGAHVSSYIKGLAAETYGRQGQLSFGTTAGNSLNAIERMRINDKGIIGIGTSSPGVGTSPMSDLKLHVNGSMTVNSGKKIAVDQNYYSHGYIQFNSSLPKARFLRYGYYGHRFDDNGGTRMVIQQGGNVGIGISTPEAKLDVAGNIKAKSSIVLDTGNTDLLLYRDGDVGDWSLLRSNKGNGIGIIGQPDRMAISVSRTTSNVGIGTTDTKGYKLGVNGKIAATEVKVATYANWADFVFKKDYSLPTLTEVENHIKENGHLANIPSAEEVKKDGFFLGEMDAKLLQKIEELTLYTIQQEKDLENQDERSKKQEARMKKLEEENVVLKYRLAKIEKLLQQLK